MTPFVIVLRGGPDAAELAALVVALQATAPKPEEPSRPDRPEWTAEGSGYLAAGSWGRVGVFRKW